MDNAVASERAAKRAQESSRTLLYSSDMLRAENAWQEGDTDLLIRLLERHEPQIGQKDLRRFEWFMLWKLIERRLTLQAINPAQTVNEITVSNDGQQLMGLASDRLFS